MDKKQTGHDDVNLKGTLVSVFFVGAVIIAMWVAVYLMYVAR
ncbi:cytochrome C oxidase subunit II [Planococcus dechangensis]|uniref:Cytochrome C oxidase subunit II n=1 Tax=Planococcus dechangensis TaxID=1176255 RepID=A0ABV9MF26_9BACL